MTLQTAENASTARKVHFMVPFPQDADFVDRPAIWTHLTEQYTGSASRIALVGFGGAGYGHHSLFAIES